MPEVPLEKLFLKSYPVGSLQLFGNSLAGLNLAPEYAAPAPWGAGASVCESVNQPFTGDYFPEIPM